MKMKINMATIVSAITFLVFLGLFNLQNYMTLLIAAMILLGGIRRRGLRASFWLLVVSLSLHTLIYGLNYGGISLDWLAKNALNPIILYITGYWLSERTNHSKKAVYILAIGFLSHGFLNTMLYTFNTSSMVQRSFRNIWGGQITATLQNLLFVPVISLLFYALYYSKSNIQKYVVIAGSAIAVYSTIVLASRTVLYLIVIILLINLVMNTRKRSAGRVYVSLLFLSIAMIILYEFDVFGVRSWVESSSLAKRLSGDISVNDSLINNVRWTMALKVLQALKDQPFGKIDVVSYAHNLFVDMAKYTGFIPAICLLVWSISQSVSYGIFTLKTKRNEWNIAILGISIAFMIVFFLEPIMEGLPIIFSGFCYLCGIMREHQDREKQAIDY